MMRFFKKKKHHHVVKQVLCVDKITQDSEVKQLQDLLDARGYDCVVTKVPVMAMYSIDFTQSFKDQEKEES